MNFLSLVKRTRQNCGISGTGPSTVVNQTGELGRLVDWVAEAWDDIQIDNENWAWMRGSWSVQTTPGKQDYTPSDISLTDFSRWREETLRIYRTSDGLGSEQHLQFVRYENFRDTYMFGTRMTGLPHCFSVRPSDSAILLGPIPTEVCTLVGEYKKSPTTLSLDADIPAMPQEYHMLVVYEAMKKYASYESAPEVLFAANEGSKLLMSRLKWGQIPDMEIGGEFP